MGLFNRVLAGIGSYLEEKGKLDEEKAKADLLYNRELALKQLEFQHDDAQEATRTQNKMAEIAATGAEARRTDLFQGVIADRRDQNKAKRDLSHDLTLKAVDFGNNVKLEKLRTSLGMSKDAFNAKLDEAKTDYANDHTIDRVVFSKDGTMQQVFKNGDVVSKGPAGSYNPGGSSSDDLGALIDNAGGSGPSGSPQTSGANVSLGASQKRAAPTGMAPQAPAAPGKPDKATVLAQVGNAYAFSAGNPQEGRKKYPQMFDPSGKLLPQDQILARVNAQFGQ